MIGALLAAQLAAAAVPDAAASGTACAAHLPFGTSASDVPGQRGEAPSVRVDGPGYTAIAAELTCGNGGFRARDVTISLSVQGVDLSRGGLAFRADEVSGLFGPAGCSPWSVSGKLSMRGARAFLWTDEPPGRQSSVETVIDRRGAVTRRSTRSRISFRSLEVETAPSPDCALSARFSAPEGGSFVTPGHEILARSLAGRVSVPIGTDVAATAGGSIGVQAEGASWALSGGGGAVISAAKAEIAVRSAPGSLLGLAHLVRNHGVRVAAPAAYEGSENDIRLGEKLDARLPVDINNVIALSDAEYEATFTGASLPMQRVIPHPGLAGVTATGTLTAKGVVGPETRISLGFSGPGAGEGGAEILRRTVVVGRDEILAATAQGRAPDIPARTESVTFTWEDDGLVPAADLAIRAGAEATLRAAGLTTLADLAADARRGAGGSRTATGEEAERIVRGAFSRIGR